MDYKVKQIRGIDSIFHDYDVSTKQNFDNFNKANQQFWEHYKMNKQSENELLEKKTVWRMLSDALLPYFDGGHLAITGSTINSFGTRNSDLDLCLAFRCGENKLYDERIAVDILKRAQNILLEEEFVLGITLIPARVPILKIYLKFPFNHLEVDMNCNCVVEIFNTHLLSYYGRLDERVPAMACYLKNWAKKQGIINPQNGALNSYSMVLMVIHFLQCAVDPPILPSLIDFFPDMFGGKANVHELEYDLQLNLPDIPKNERSLAELIYGFLNYYAQFDYKNVGISIREGRLFDRTRQPKHGKRFLFMLEEAYDGMTVPKNLTKQQKLQKIVNGFQEARDELLMYIAGATYSTILQQNFCVQSEQPSITKPSMTKTTANLEQNLLHPSSGNMPVPNSQINLPVGLTNRIFVSGPCLHPEHMNPRRCQKEDLRIFFSQFGKINIVSAKKMNDDMSITCSVVFDNCDSAANCIQQRNYKIRDRDFIVWASTPTKSMKKKIIANLSQYMPGPLSENVLTPNIQGYPPAESNLGYQWPLDTVSRSSEAYESVKDCSTNSSEWPQNRGLASFYKPGYK